MGAPRFASLKDLGAGAWRVSASSPFDPSVPARAVASGRPAAGAGGQNNDLLHDMLWHAMQEEFGGHGLVREFEGVVKGRKYRVDIAIPSERIAIEIDGWQWHGKHKGDFVRDRERQNLITAECWQFLRFTAGMIRKDMAGCLELVRKTLRNRVTVN